MFCRCRRLVDPRGPAGDRGPDLGRSPSRRKPVRCHGLRRDDEVAQAAKLAFSLFSEGVVTVTVSAAALSRGLCPLPPRPAARRPKQRFCSVCRRTVSNSLEVTGHRMTARTSPQEGLTRGCIATTTSGGGVSTGGGDPASPAAASSRGKSQPWRLAHTGRRHALLRPPLDDRNDRSRPRPPAQLRPQKVWSTSRRLGRHAVTRAACDGAGPPTLDYAGSPGGRCCGKDAAPRPAVRRRPGRVGPPAAAGVPGILRAPTMVRPINADVATSSTANVFMLGGSAREIVLRCPQVPNRRVSFNRFTLGRAPDAMMSGCRR